MPLGVTIHHCRVLDKLGHLEACVEALRQSVASGQASGSELAENEGQTFFFVLSKDSECAISCRVVDCLSGGQAFLVVSEPKA